MTLTEFLLARIAEDEAMWSLAAEGQLALQVTAPKHSVPAIPTRGFADRRLAECEAKRRIVELHRPSPEYDSQACVLCQWDVDCDSPKHDHQYSEGERDEWPCETIMALALPYADHPDYREEWKP